MAGLFHYHNSWSVFIQSFPRTKIFCCYHREKNIYNLQSDVQSLAFMTFEPLTSRFFLWGLCSSQSPPMLLPLCFRLQRPICVPFCLISLTPPPLCAWVACTPSRKSSVTFLDQCGFTAPFWMWNFVLLQWFAFSLALFIKSFFAKIFDSLLPPLDCDLGLLFFMGLLSRVLVWSRHSNICWKINSSPYI